MQGVVVMRHQIADVGRGDAHLGLVEIDREYLGHLHDVDQVAEQGDQRAFGRHQDRTLLAQLLEERQRLDFHPMLDQPVFLAVRRGVVFLEIVPLCVRHCAPLPVDCRPPLKRSQIFDQLVDLLRRQLTTLVGCRFIGNDSLDFGRLPD
jgi:hypothetical protein